MNVARIASHQRRRGTSAGIALGVFLLAGCCSAARRPAFTTQETARPAPPAAEAGAASTERSDVADDAAGFSPAPVLRAKVTTWNGKPLIVVHTKVPGARWRAALLPLPVTEDGAREYRLVLVPPTQFQDDTAGAIGEPEASPAEQTVLSCEDFPDDVEQVVIYGDDDALVIPTK